MVARGPQAARVNDAAPFATRPPRCSRSAARSNCIALQPRRSSPGLRQRRSTPQRPLGDAVPVLSAVAQRADSEVEQFEDAGGAAALMIDEARAGASQRAIDGHRRDVAGTRRCGRSRRRGHSAPIDPPVLAKPRSSVLNGSPRRERDPQSSASAGPDRQASVTGRRSFYDDGGEAIAAIRNGECGPARARRLEGGSQGRPALAGPARWSSCGVCGLSGPGDRRRLRHRRPALGDGA